MSIRTNNPVTSSLVVAAELMASRWDIGDPNSLKEIASGLSDAVVAMVTPKLKKEVIQDLQLLGDSPLFTLLLDLVSSEVEDSPKELSVLAQVKKHARVLNPLHFWFPQSLK